MTIISRFGHCDRGNYQENTGNAEIWQPTRMFPCLNENFSTFMMRVHFHFNFSTFMMQYMIRISDSSWRFAKEASSQKFSMINLSRTSSWTFFLLTLASSSTLVPPNSGKRTWSPTLTDKGTVSPLSLRLPGPQATTFPSRTFPIDFSGSMIPPFVFVSAAILSMSTRSKRGLKRFSVAW